MSRTVWRIGTDTPAYQAHDLTGAGAKATGGRWNPAGMAVVYGSESRALACLETMVHLNAGGLPLNRYLVAVSIPEPVWERARRVRPEALPVGWDAAPAGQVSISFGTDWVRAGASALLLVPSVIVPEECDVMINPAHADAAAITAVKLRRWMYDPRLRRAA